MIRPLSSYEEREGTNSVSELDKDKDSQLDVNQDQQIVDNNNKSQQHDNNGQLDIEQQQQQQQQDDGSNNNTNDSADNQSNNNTTDDDGEPIPSGTGAVSKDCSASELIGWSEILSKWHLNLNQRPKGLDTLVKNGIPEPLRGEVWQLLSNAEQCSGLMDRYRLLLTKTAPTEQIILRDVHRTYPAHENFRSGAGSSSLLDSLFKVCKAYAVFDEEVGYCQGLSFLAAALLLHMPEEQAFCVFVRIMQNYGLRDLFRNNFDELYLKFYQLDRLLEDHMPDLHHHFNKIGLEPFTYASQWFLTVFTAKFSLNAVFYIMDIFLLNGIDTIFQIALALLASSKQELLELDFEGVLKYFRVQMPKLYRDQENVQKMIRASSEVNLKRLKKYAKNYEAIRQKEKLMENPMVRLQRENSKLTENNIRLEHENDDLARDLVASKIQLRAQLDLLEDKADTLNRALTYSKQDCQSYMTTISDMEDERSRLEIEVSQLKEVCRRELLRAEGEIARDNNIIADYKRICSQLSNRIDAQINCVNSFNSSMKDNLQANGADNCKDSKCYKLFCFESDRLVETLNSAEALVKYEKREEPQMSPKLNYDKLKQQVSTESDPTNRSLGAYIQSGDSDSTEESDSKIQKLTQHIGELEVELARTKLALVEAECKCQQLTHDMNAGTAVKTENQSHGSSFVGRLDFMKASVSNKLSPKSAGATLAKFNNLISDKISNISLQSTTANTNYTAASSNILNVDSYTAMKSSVNKQSIKMSAQDDKIIQLPSLKLQDPKSGSGSDNQTQAITRHTSTGTETNKC